MSARRKDSASSRATSRSDLKAEVPLQALLLADSFERQFSPLTQTQPKALLPLVNLPLITYSLYFLHKAGVQECFIVVRAFPAVIREYCQSLRSSLSSMRMTVLMVNENCTSIGDVFRHIHQLEIIRSDFFIYMGADTIADLDMDHIITAHQKRAADDPEAIMTVVLKRAAPKHRIRSNGDNLMVALASPSQKVLGYQNPLSSRSRLVADVDIMIDNPIVTFHKDLLNTCIYVCSPAVLTLFNDQFDLQNIETDFFSQVLGSSIMSTSVYAHLLHDEYAARVDCLKTYDSVSRDIIERWAFGLLNCNGSRFSVDGLGPRPAYSTQRLHIYKEIGSTSTTTPRIAQSAVIKRNTVIGGGCQIGTRTYIEDTVIDRNVTLGDDVYCTGSYIWSGSTVGDRTVIDRAIIARNVQIGSDVNIGRGTIVGEGVQIGRGVQIPPYTKLWVPIQRRPAHEFGIDDMGLDRLRIGHTDSADDGKDPNITPFDLGLGGTGCLYTGDEDDAVEEMLDEEEEDLPQSDIDRLRLARISCNSLAPDKDAIAFRDERIAELECDENDDNDSLMTFGSDDECEVSDVEGVDDSAWDEEGYNASVLYREIKATIERCREQDIADKSDILLEVANLKIADNASLTTYASCILLTVFDLIEPAPVQSQKPSTAVLKSLSRLLREYNFLLEKYGQGSDENHILFIRGLVKACECEDKPYRLLFPFALKALYQLDAISGEAILEWVDLEDSDQQFVQSASELIEYLKESDDEETESDED